MASRATASSTHAIRTEGVKLMESVVNSFADTLDPDVLEGIVVMLCCCVMYDEDIHAV